MDKQEKIPEEIEVHYLKTSNYRTYHVDGAFGGLTPSGMLYMELFVQRAPTPKKIIYKLSEDGSLGDELGREGKIGIIREVESGLVMDVRAAESLVEWLSRKIEEAKKLA